jgi:hypothetical protein
VNNPAPAGNEPAAYVFSGAAAAIHKAVAVALGVEMTANSLPVVMTPSRLSEGRCGQVIIPQLSTEMMPCFRVRPATYKQAIGAAAVMETVRACGISQVRPKP